MSASAAANAPKRRAPRYARTLIGGEGVKLTEDQSSALTALRAGRNIMLTGDAGTGKSFLIDTFLEECSVAGRQCLAMAPTGIAALNLRGGSTIHRTLGLPPTFLDPDEPVGLPRKVLKEADVIVIDEFSMCRVDLFDRVARMIIAAEKATAPKQVVVVGDPFQLPPVVTSDDEGVFLERYGSVSGYCYLSGFWRAFDFEPHILREVIRQREDSELSENLALARVGDAACIPYFNQFSVSAHEEADEGAIWLCPRNSTAGAINKRRLDSNPARPYVFTARVSGKVGKGDKPTDDVVTLKAGCRVMSVANDPLERYANGSIGTVVSIDMNDAEPICVAFENGLHVRIGMKTWEIQKSVVVPDGVNPETGERKNKIVSETVGVFEQIPLRLAYAITIHKAQGQTYSRVNVDTRVFERGQLYVALSRATSSEGITLFPKIDPDRLRPNSEAISFYNSVLERERMTYDESSGGAVIAIPVGRPAPDGYEGIAIPHPLAARAIDALSSAGIPLSESCREFAAGDICE